MNKLLYILLTKSSILVGGQAVIEGVMMRVPGAYATAVRLKDNTIIFKRKTFKSIIEKKAMEKKIIIRGMINLYESMKMGYETLEWSAQMNEDTTTVSKDKNIFLDFFINLLSVVFAISLFFLLPLVFTFYFKTTINQPFLFNIISGSIRIIIFICYLLLISQIKDIKTLFQYHGAEHQTVYNFESGLQLNVTNASTFSTKHPRCGTSFVFIIMLVAILSHALIDSFLLLFINHLTIYIRFISHILFLPLIGGIGYEVLKFLAKHQNSSFFNYLSKPGLWLQMITTKKPNAKQLEVAITALETAFGKKKLKKHSGKKFIAEAIG